jgi:hypothetical protein
MESKAGKMRVINVNDPNGRCIACGARLSSLGSFQYAGETARETTDTAKYRLEKNACAQCGKEFWLRYDIFDDNGHISEMVFNGDINDPEYDWRMLWSKKQVDKIQKHLATCPICCDLQDKVMLEDAMIGSFIRSFPPNILKALNG